MTLTAHAVTRTGVLQQLDGDSNTPLLATGNATYNSATYPRVGNDAQAHLSNHNLYLWKA